MNHDSMYVKANCCTPAWSGYRNIVLLARHIQFVQKQSHARLDELTADHQIRRGPTLDTHQQRVEAIVAIKIALGGRKDPLGISTGPEALVRRPHDGPAVPADLSWSTQDIGWYCGIPRAGEECQLQTVTGRRV